MAARVWVGPAEHTPAGWDRYATLDEFLSLSRPVGHVVIDDRPALLRDGDFARVFEHSPLASIFRLVGPWREGIARTDPTWPLLTTVCFNAWTPDHPAPWLPQTAGYDEIAAADSVTDLSGFGVCLLISNTELHSMWADAILAAGAYLDDQQPHLLIRDRAETGAAILPSMTVHLRHAPWNTEPSTSQQELTVSVLDSPLRVISRIATLLKRVSP